MLRKTLTKLHWLFGITAGLILSIMGVTGALVSYEDPILKTLNPNSFYVQPQNTPRLTPLDIYQRINTLFPHHKINSITLSGINNQSSVISISDQQRQHGQSIYLNPYSGAVLPAAQGEHFFDLMLDIHRYLTLDNMGSQLTGASTLILLFFILSGVYLRWPARKNLLKFKEWFSIRWHLKGRSFLWYLHAVMGTWMLVFYFTLALSGPFFSYDWYRQGVYFISGVEAPKTRMQQKLQDSPLSHPKIDLPATLNLSWQAFQQQVPRYSSVTYRFQNLKNNTLDMFYLDINPTHDRARNNIKYNIAQQRIESIVRYNDKQLNEKVVSSIRAIHTGSFFGPIWQLMTTLAALCMPVFFVTGWMMYIKRRQQKKLMQAKRAQLNQ